LLEDFKVPLIERIRLHFEGAKRRKRIEEHLARKKVHFARIVAVLAIFAIIFALAMTNKLFWAVVTSNSMAPTLKRGDMYLAQAIYVEPKVGDIVMFKRSDIQPPITHRILKIEGDRIYTGGDASGPDPWFITKEDIIAKAVMIGGKPIVIRGFGSYFILDAKEMRSIGPYGQEYLFYKNLVQTFKSYALAIIIICISLYLYMELRGY